MSIGKETILLRARIAEKKRRLNDMTFRADQHIITLRDIIDPYTEDFTDMDMQRAMVYINDLNGLVKEGKELKADIARLERDLNG